MNVCVQMFLTQAAAIYEKFVSTRENCTGHVRGASVHFEKISHELHTTSFD